MVRVAIISATITGNRGAEAMLTTIINRVLAREPKAVINVFSYYPEIDKKIITNPNIRIFSSTPLYLVTVLFPFSLFLSVLKFFSLTLLRNIFPEAVRALEQSDVLVDLAGVSFIDGREKFLPFNILTILPAMLLGVPVVKFSQAIGPFRHLFTRLSARLVLTRCTKIFARGDQTYQHLQELSFSEGVVDIASDVVFLHQLGDAISTENEEYVAKLENTLKELKHNNKSIIGFCPSAVIASNAKKEGWNYPELMYQIVKNLLVNGYTLFLFPNATRKESQGNLRNNDLPVIQQIVSYFNAQDELSKHLYYVTENINADSIKRLLTCCDYAIVSRFHAMVTSLCLEKPTMVLGWGHKYLEVMDKFSFGEYVLDYKNKDVPTTIQIIEALIENERSIRQKIIATLPEVKQSSQRQIDYLFELLNI